MAINDDNINICNKETIKYMGIKKESSKYISQKLLGEWKSDNISELFRIYGIDKYHARVYYMNSKGVSFGHFRLYLYEINIDEFDMVLFRTSYGVSNTNKIYNNDKALLRIRGRKHGVWVCKDSGIKLRPLKFMDEFYIDDTSGVAGDVGGLVKNFLMGRYPWYGFIKRDIKYRNRALNYVINNGDLTNHGIIKLFYGFDYNLSKTLQELDNSSSYRTDYQNLQFYKPWITGENKFNPTMVKDNFGLYIDTLHMAKTLNYKVNLGWGLKRLISEHDKMGKLLSKIIYTYDSSELDNHQIYVDFAERYKYNLLTNMEELAYEGIRLNHCVASYKSDINNGISGIYRVNDYTLELGITTRGLQLKQLQGFGNKVEVPMEVRSEILNHLEEFNYYGGLELCRDSGVSGRYGFNGDLPF